MSALTFTPKHSLVYQTFAQKSLRPLPQILSTHVDSFDNSRVLWDSTAAIFNIKFSPDGNRVLAHGQGMGVRMWNAKTLKLISALKGRHTSSIESAAFSSDGSLIATGGGDARICIWDGYTGVFKEKLPLRHKGWILHVEFALSDTVVIGVDENHKILIWSLDQTIPRARMMQTTPHTEEVTFVATSPDRRLLATFSTDKTVKLWDIETGAAIGEPMLGSDTVSCGVFSTDGAKIIAGYNDGIVVIWDVSTQALIHTLKPPTVDTKSQTRDVCAVAVSPKGNLVAVGGPDLVLWHIETGELLCSAEKEEVNCLSFDHTGDRLISGSWKFHVTVWDIRSNESCDKLDVTMKGTVLKAHTGCVNDVASSPSGNLIASGCMDGTLRMWDMDLIEKAYIDESLKRPHEKVTYIAASDDGTRLVSVGEGLNFQMWDFNTGEKIGTIFHSTEGEVLKVVFSFDRDLWASVHRESTVSIWRYGGDDIAPTATAIKCDQNHITWTAFVQYKPYMATAGWNNSIRVWDLASHTCVAQYDHVYRPMRMTISKDGEYLAVALYQSEGHKWYLGSHRLVGGDSIKEGEGWKSNGSIDSILISPDGKTIVLSTQRSIKLFDTENPLQYHASFTEPLFTSDTPPLRCVPSFSTDGRYLFFWKWAFNLKNVRRDTQSNPLTLIPAKGEVLPHNHLSPLYVDRPFGQICSVRWGEPLLLLPADVRVRPWKAHENIMALGSSDGRVFIIRFPEEFI
jgi:WD40 repeat protein